MRTLCFTVDLDRDVNEATAGSAAAVSLDRGAGNAPRFSSTYAGAGLLAEMLDGLGVKATFFAEARALKESKAYEFLGGHDVALHGLDHEDFNGNKTGVRLDEGAIRDIFERSISMIRDCVGYQPKGFRTPYMDVNETVESILPEYGMKYDSSYYAYLEKEFRPYRLDNGVVEFPVPKGKDSRDKDMAAYLWPMHEGVRSPADFIGMARQMEDGVFTIATHTWHIVESRKNGRMDSTAVSKNLNNVREILETLMDDGFEIRTMADIAGR